MRLWDSIGEKRRQPPAEARWVLENSKSGLSSGAQDPSKISKKRSNSSAYGMTVNWFILLTAIAIVPAKYHWSAWVVAAGVAALQAFNVRFD